MDLDTDQAIQEIIRGPQFAHVTMLTIAYVHFLSSDNWSPLSHVFNMSLALDAGIA